MWRAGKPSPNDPAWIAIHLGGGPRRVLLVWSDAGSYNYNETTYGSPADYQIAVAADSTNGEDGTWHSVRSVTDNHVHARGHSFEFSGQSWVKFVVSRAPDNSPNGVSLDEIDIHDLSAGGTDTWFFAGDSITAFCFDRATPARQPSFAEWVHRASPQYFPAMINGGIGGITSRYAREHVDEWLAMNPDFHYWALGFGTNDAASGAENPSEYKANMQVVIAKTRAAGRVPILARIPYAADGTHPHLARFNDVVDELRSAADLPAGPDLYAWFQAHPDQLYDKLHPDDAGRVATNRLWGEATRWLYPE